MTTPRSTQAGFGTILVISIAVVVVVIAGIGFFVTNQRTKTAPADAATNNMPAAPPTPTIKPTPTPATPTSSGVTLAVKEWGIEIPLPDSLKDAYYVPSIGSADPDGSVNTIWLGLKSKDTETCAAVLGNTGGSVLAGIVRVLPTDTEPVTGRLYTEELPTGITIGKYYFGFMPQISSRNKCDATTRDIVNSAFGAAIKDTKISTPSTDETN